MRNPPSPLLVLLLVSALLPVSSASAQPPRYTVANTHSHNDYEQPIPFWSAWQARFGSIEADIWLVDGRVIIGHDRKEVSAGRTLEEYYIRPLEACMEKNGGHPYTDISRRLQILIDVKADSVATLDALINVLDKYPLLEHSRSLTWVISGNRPPSERYTSYPDFIRFDGVLHAQYSAEALSRIALMSDDLEAYTHWNGMVDISADDRQRLEDAIGDAHRRHLPVRFWDAPDFSRAWQSLQELHVDYINTDHIDELASWLNSR
jgi:alkaline phosphatase